MQPENDAIESDDPLKQGVEALAKGDTAHALELFDRAAKAKPGRPAPLLKAANLLRDLDRLAEAEEKYQAVLALAPENMASLIGLAHIARKKNDSDAALTYLQKAQKGDPENLKVLMQLGNLFRSTSRWKEARSAYESVVEIDPANAKAMVHLGQIARSRGEAEGAIAWLKRALAADPNVPGAATWLAELVGESDEAGQVPEEDHADGAGESRRALRRSIRETRVKGGDAAASEYLRRASLAEPDNLEILAELAASLRRLDRLDEAADVYKRILEKDDRNIDANLGMAFIARKHRNHDSALAHFQTAGKLDPKNLQTQLHIAEVLSALNRTDEANAVCQAVLATSPKDPKTLAALGAVAQKNNNWTAAATYFEAASAADPSRVQFRIQLGKAYCDLMRLDDAERIFRDILKMAPQSIEATIGLGETARLRGDTGAALASYEAAAKLAPGNLRAKAAIRSLKIAEGEFDWRAEIEDATAVVRDPDATVGAQLTAATMLVEHGITEIAGPVLARLQTQSPVARQLILAVREIERMGLAQPFSADADTSDPGDSQLDALQGFHEKPVKGSDTLLIVFAGRNNRVWMTFSLLHRILRATGVSIVYVRDLQETWYTRGVVGLGDDYESAVAAFKARAGQYGARRILTLGNCTGCLGALRFGLSLGAAGVLGISPNVRPVASLKPEYAARVEALRRQLPAGHKDMHTRYVEAAKRPDVALIYGEQCEPDASDAQFMTDVPGVKIAGIPEATGHDGVKDLLIRGLLEPLLREFIANGAVSHELLSRISASKSP